MIVRIPKSAVSGVNAEKSQAVRPSVNATYFFPPKGFVISPFRGQCLAEHKATPSVSNDHRISSKEKNAFLQI